MDEFRVIEQVKAELQRRLAGPPQRTFREVAEELDMNHGNLQKFLNGERLVSLETFSRICEILQFELKPRRKTKGK